MILDFDDTCWSHNDDDWRRSLIETLVLVKRLEQHAVLATPAEMLTWCGQHLTLFVEYFKTRLTSAQPRTNALTIRISPTGASTVNGAPPWGLTAEAASAIISRPFRLVLENNESDLGFVKSTVPRFSTWQDRGWLEPIMGGGSPMEAEINSTSADVVGRWRTFFLFDSDRLHPTELAPSWTPPGGDGCQGHKFEVACTGMPRERWHRLERRSIENYLPPSVLSPIGSATTATLFGSSVGAMARFYNMKNGLGGDGISPADPKKAVRSGRSLGFWTSLSQADVTALESGFGKNISSQFSNVPTHHPWPADVIAEMNALADALQDAM